MPTLRHCLASCSLLVLGSNSLCLAQNASSDPPYSVVDRGGFYRVLERTVSVTNLANGEVSAQVQSYTELGAGMNYVSNGQWVEAQDLVEIVPGGAQAVHGQMTAVFQSDITSKGAISLTTAGGEVFQSHPVGLFYADSVSGKLAQIGAVQASVGTLYPPNVIVFSNVLSGVRADLMLVWARNGYEQNLVLKQAPPKPESFGLSSSSTTLQMWSAMDNCPVPQEQRPVLLDSGLEDHILIFGDAWFPVGAAFVLGATPLPPAGQAAQIRVLRPGAEGTVPVAKTLANIAGQQVLIEEVRYSDLVPVLSQLPQASVQAEGGRNVLLADRAKFLAPEPKTAVLDQTLQVASTPYQPSGVVLDYSELSGGATTYTFTNGNTYHIASSFEVGPGIAYFQQNACVKLDTNADLLVYGSVSCASSGSPTVFTSSDDNGYGLIITNSTANPGYAAAEDLWLYFPTNQTIVQNVRLRWAQSAIRYDASAVNGPHLSSASLEDSTKGIFLNIGADTLYLSQVSECNVTTPVYNYKGTSQVSGIVTTNCGVVSVAMVNDPGWDASGLDTNKNSQTECSFAVLDSTNIVAAFMNTHLSEYELADSVPSFPGIPSPRMTSWAVSMNGGTTFTDNGPILPISTVTIGSTVITNGASDPIHGDGGDPTMAYDAQSKVVYLLVNTSREQTNWYGPRLWASTNYGQSFSPVNMDVPGLDGNGSHFVFHGDKPTIKVSQTNLYVACSEEGPIRVWATHSSNRGTNWDSPHILDTANNGDVRGVDIVIVPDGTVYFFWLNTSGTTNQLRYSSLFTNGVWGSAANIGPKLNSTNAIDGSGDLLRSNGAEANDHFQDNSFPHVVYANGKIYIAYADLPSPNSSTDRGDIFLIEAVVNWVSHALYVSSGPIKVNNDHTQTDQWDPSITANPSGTELFIGYYSRQIDPVTNSWIMAYGAKAYITNGLSLATFECIPIGPTSFQPVFAGTSVSPTNTWAFDPVWPPGNVCLDTNAVADGSQGTDNTQCPAWPGGDGFATGSQYSTFRADDYTWAASDSNYFYFAWSDCSRTNGLSPKARPDADIKFGKIKQ